MPAQATPLRVLLVDDSEDDAELILRRLRRSGYAPSHERVADAAAMRAALGGGEWELIVCDYTMPSFNALDGLAILQERELDIPFIIVSGTIGEETAVEAMAAGAGDYVMKGNMARLGPAVDRELREAEERATRRRAEAQLRYLADHDPLTGLFNRRRFEEEVSRYMAYSARYGSGGSLLVLDVDNFKYVNDTLGHRAGDDLIRGIARLVRGRLRETDVMARLGGDEFAVLLHGVERAEARKVADELLGIVRGHSFALERRPVHVTMSIGLGPLDIREGCGDELLARADLAMYEAKEAGRDRVAEFTRAGRAQMRAQRTISERVRGALEHDSFVLYVQPILDLRSNRVSQHELLLRMQGNGAGLLAPRAFLGTAHRFGLMQQVDRWVVREAIRLAAEESGGGVAPLLEVNLSGRSMDDPDLPALIEDEVNACGIDPASLIFEVTETEAVADIAQARRFAESLTRLGCQFALDDFGAGFSSFYYLKHLPISYLKIDGDFIRDLPRTKIDQLVVKALVDIARGLGIKTIAEYVEDEETLELLRRYGVDYAQGFAVGRPGPIPESSVAPESPRRRRFSAQRVGATAT